MQKRVLAFCLLALLMIPRGVAQAVVPVLSHITTQEKIIALTFDDGWSNSTSEKVRQILQDHTVVATIFPVSTWAASNRSIIKRFLDDGHEIGNHSATHPKLTSLSRKQQEQEIREAHEALAKLAGEQLTNFFRPPYGAYNQDTLQVAAKLGLQPVTWSVDSWDWRDIPVEQVVKRTLEGAKPGAVILCI